MYEAFDNQLPESMPENVQPAPPTPPPTVRREKKSTFANSFFVKYGFKFILGLVIIVVFLTVVQCDIRKPEAPSWTTNLTIPMMNRTYAMPEIIEKIDQPGLGFDQDSNIIFTYSADIDTFQIDNQELQVDDLALSVQKTLGSIDLDLSSPPDQTYNLTDLITVIGTVIPGTDFDIYYDLPIFPEYDWATVATGGFYVIINNDLGIDLSLVQIDVIDRYYVRSITSPPAEITSGIPSGSKDSVYVDLSGQTVSCQLGMDVHCVTPGGTILVLTDKTMSSTVATNTITVTSARARIPELELDLSNNVEIANENTIFSAELSSGTAVLNITNQTNLTANLDLFLPDFNLNGTPLTRSVILNGQQTQQINIDLAGYSFVPLDQTYPQNIQCSTAVVIDSTSPGKVDVFDTDNIAIDVNISNLDFESIDGLFAGAQAQFNDVALNVDLPTGFDEIQLVNAELVLEIDNAFGFDGDIIININGDNGQNLTIDTSILAGSIISPTHTIIIENDLASFLNPVPEQITIGGNADFSGAGSLTVDDYLFASVSIESPMEMVIDNVTFDGDMSSEKIDQEDIDMITEHVIEARIISAIENHLPLGAVVDIYLGGDSATVLSNPQLVISLAIDAGLTDAGGNVIEITESENTITLDSIDIKILENPILYSSQVITLQSTNGETVRINSDDYINVGAIVEVEYLFDGEF